jgi:phospholipid/cholesterol/gamma-HCH transport system substrate-binding protein
METRASYILVGAFVIGLMAAGVFFVIRFAASDRGTYVVTLPVIFTNDVTGLSNSADVRYRGVPVGKVKSIKLETDQDRIRVVIQIDPNTPIWTDTEATLETPGLTGAPFVQLKRKPDSAKTPDELKITPRKFDLSNRVEREKIVIKGGVTDLQAALRSIPQTMKEIENTAKKISNFAAAGQKILTDNEAEIKRLVKNMGNALERYERVGAILEKDLPRYTNAADGVSKMTNEIQLMIRENRRPIADFAATGLYEFSLFLTDTRQFLRSFNRLIQKLESDPSGFLFGNRQKGYQTRGR